MATGFRVLQIWLDRARASGVGTFGRELVAHLAGAGVACDLGGLPDDPDYRAKAYDAVHIHGIWLPPEHRACRWAVAKGIPVVWSTHGMTAPWALRSKALKKRLAWWLYQRRDLFGASVVHVTSAQEERWVRDVGYRGRVVVIPLGTSLDASLAPPPRSADGPLKLLFVGRLHPVKALPDLLRALASVPSVALRLVGPDEAGHRAELEALVGELGLAERVTFAGPKFGADLEAEYRACDVLALPSHTENFGGVVIDALACGRPVIASRHTPWSELEANRCGWWADNGVAGLAEALVRAAALPRAELDAMGDRGRALVRATYSWSAVATAMADVYRGLSA